MLVGQVLQDRYHVVARVHSNATRDTYLALDKSGATPIQYILKCFQVGSENPGGVLEKRLQTAAQIQQFDRLSPQIPSLVQYWLEGEHFLAAYEYVDSLPLDRATFSEHQMVALLAEIIEVLHPLHQQQIGHGNLHWGQLARQVSDQKLMVMDLGSLALLDYPSFSDPRSLRRDLRALGSIGWQAFVGGDESQGGLSEPVTKFLERLLSDDLDLQYPSLMTAWLDLGKIMQQMMTDQESPEFDPQYLKEQMDQHLVAGRPEEAIAHCTKLLEMDPNPLYFHNRGIIYAQELHNYRRAIQDYDTAISLKPNFAHAYKNRAYAQRMLGRLPEAIADYDHSLALLPNLAIGYWERGLAYQDLGESPAATADFTTFLSYNAYHAEAYVQRAIAAQHMGEIPAAMADYEQAIQCNPELALAYYHRADCQASQGDFAAAIADYDRTLKLSPQWAAAYQRRGAIHYQQGAIDLARQDYQQALALEPTATLHYQYGLMAPDPAAAKESFDQALELDPHLIKAYLQRGSLTRRAGDLDRAFADYSKGLELDGESIDCLCGRAIVRQELQDYGGAISDYQRAAHLCLDRGRQQEYEKLLKILESLQRIGL
jgi:tetratricopeptide (TPR) repeat protein